MRENTETAAFSSVGTMPPGGARLEAVGFSSRSMRWLTWRKRRVTSPMTALTMVTDAEGADTRN